MTFEEWRDRKGFPVTHPALEPLWRECWETAQKSLQETVIVPRMPSIVEWALEPLTDTPHPNPSGRTTLDDR